MSNVILPPVFLYGKALPWVDKIKHLGHTILSDLSMDSDMMIKRAIFINKHHEILQEFYFAHPYVLFNIIDKYCCDFYGSNIWNLSKCDKLFNQFNCSVRNTWNLPRNTHSYFIEEFMGKKHLMIQL